ncbi:hypothetical protein [Paenibacillus senegalensis]|uniref:hypothetical protein n=1 Tax=Paenibacillus senegalensis TaxID=1465766 RepID=UPI000288824B|nr:hypothetical protein [Paenibacillus senegalensis]
MQYYADFDDKGNMSGFYVDEIHGDAIPKTAIPITEEEWRAYVAETWKYKLDNGTIREKTQEELDEEAAKLPPAPPSAEERITQLEAENADLWYEIMWKKRKSEGMFSKLRFGKKS